MAKKDKFGNPLEDIVRPTRRGFMQGAGAIGGKTIFGGAAAPAAILGKVTSIGACPEVVCLNLAASEPISDFIGFDTLPMLKRLIGDRSSKTLASFPFLSAIDDFDYKSFVTRPDDSDIGLYSYFGRFEYFFGHMSGLVHVHNALNHINDKNQLYWSILADVLRDKVRRNPLPALLSEGSAEEGEWVYHPWVNDFLYSEEREDILRVFQYYDPKEFEFIADFLDRGKLETMIYDLTRDVFQSMKIMEQKIPDFWDVMHQKAGRIFGGGVCSDAGVHFEEMQSHLFMGFDVRNMDVDDYFAAIEQHYINTYHVSSGFFKTLKPEHAKILRAFEQHPLVRRFHQSEDVLVDRVGFVPSHLKPLNAAEQQMVGDAEAVFDRFREVYPSPKINEPLEYLEKPFNIDEFEQKIEGSVREKQARRTLSDLEKVDISALGLCAGFENPLPEMQGGLRLCFDAAQTYRRISLESLSATVGALRKILPKSVVVSQSREYVLPDYLQRKKGDVEAYLVDHAHARYVDGDPAISEVVHLIASNETDLKTLALMDSWVGNRAKFIKDIEPIVQKNARDAKSVFGVALKYLGLNRG